MRGSRQTSERATSGLQPGRSGSTNAPSATSRSR
ncbi:hypothetical protein PC128_g23859 [Phytophthora cactorum]|nr:hypothetical protein PC120_g22746 [Phytophthora cactorum]KAG3118348.1 hypothetical protein PI125_g2980 [Phytophthora idaei]KAG3147138.1 hypothetical protein PC128_g23859 [Phytophthora cactorum]KAG4041241.1 hypothetical protein PC123_g23238 [Phytophthora cactorum]